MKKSVFELARRVRVPAMASVWYMGAGAVGKLMGVVTTPIFTRLLDGEEYGQFTLYMTLLGGASVILSVFNSGSAFYEGIKKNEDKKGGYLKGVLRVNFAIYVLICLLLFAFFPFSELDVVFFIPLCLQLLCDGIVAVMLSIMRFYYKYRLVSLVGLVSGILPPTMSLIIMLFIGADFSVRIYSLLLVSVTTAIFSLFYIKKLISDGGKPAAKLSEVVRYSLPLLPHGIWTAVSVQADKLIISALMGSVALAKYSVIYSVGVGMQFLVTALGSALSPWIVRRLAEGEEERIGSLILPLSIGYSALVLCVMTISPEVIALLAPREYLDAYPALIPILLSCPIFFISSVVTVGLVHSGRRSYPIILSLISAAVCILLNYTLTRGSGYLGAGLSVLLSQAVSCVVGILLLRRGGFVRMLRPLPLGGVMLICVAFGVGMSFLTDSILARGIMLIIPLFMLIYAALKILPQITEKGRKIAS